VSAIGRRRALEALAALPVTGGLLDCTPPRGQPESAQADAPATRGADAPERRPGWEPGFFSLEQALSVEDVAEQLIPETDTPGARRAGVAELIESLVRDVFEEQERGAFLAGIEALDTLARTATGRAFPACTPEEQQGVLEKLAAATLAQQSKAGGEHGSSALEPAARFWLRMRDLTISGFAQSKLGATLAFAYDPEPGEYQGCVPLESAGKTWAL
jgi:Gluconate 2-dehydrogenase subunit 3